MIWETIQSTIVNRNYVWGSLKDRLKNAKPGMPAEMVPEESRMLMVDHFGIPEPKTSQEAESFLNDLQNKDPEKIKKFLQAHDDNYSYDLPWHQPLNLMLNSNLRK